MRLTVTVLLLALAAMPACAVVVTVTPVTTTPTGVTTVVENQLTNGWSIVTNRFGVGEISPSGPCVTETPFGFNSAWNGQGVDFGRGAFYASCDYVGQGSNAGDDKTPSSVWLGLDTFGGQPLAGVKLSQIKSLNYWAYVSKIPSRLQDNTSPDNWDSWSQGWLYPSQPIMLQLIVKMPASMGYGDFYGRVALQYRPWLDGNNPIKGDPKYEDGLGIWKYYDCLTGGHWMLSGTDKDAAMIDIANWQSLLSYTVGTAGNTTTLGNCELMATTTSYTKYGADYKSPGWNGTTNPEGWPNTSGTGKTINFTVGARMSTIKWPGETSSTVWAHLESIGFRGQLDWFTLGIDKNGNGNDNDSGEKFTYNFEPAQNDARPMLVYLSQKDLRRPNINKVIENRTPATLYDKLYKIAGSIPTTSDVGNLSGNPWFQCDDGSGLPQLTRTYTSRIQHSDNLWLSPGQFKEVWGHLELPRWPWTVGTPTVALPYVLWSDESHVQ
jgi:hypothetical protein